MDSSLLRPHPLRLHQGTVQYALHSLYSYTHYGYTKRRAELICLDASTVPTNVKHGKSTEQRTQRAGDGTMLVVALRMPGVYAWNDRLIVGPLLRGELRTVPGSRHGAKVDFVYIENAAHAHCCAVETVLDDSPGGR
jgi:nucleoside-diphosphate-sugar epimerase